MPEMCPEYNMYVVQIYLTYLSPYVGLSMNNIGYLNPV
jgi:hypothetical protein